MAGGNIDSEIAAQLNQCRLFLALVSPDFLSSQYCYETEMTNAIRRHDAGEIVVVPIILEPCDWLSCAGTSHIRGCATDLDYRWEIAR
jgi:TIR domain